MIVDTSPQAQSLPWLQALRHPPAPAVPRLAGPRDALLQVALVALGLVLPFSPAAVSVLLLLMSFLALFSIEPLRRTAAWREPVAAIGLVLFAYVALHTLLAGPWTPASLSIVNKYHELLLFPVLLALFIVASRPQAFLWGLAAGSLAYALAHWTAAWIPWLGAELGSKRISAGFCLALSAYLLLHERGRLAWLWRCIAAVLALTVLFRIEGRTGHVVLLLVAAVALWRLAPARWRLPATVAGCAALLVVALASPTVQMRLQETIDDLEATRAGPVTSTSIRVGLLANAWSVASAHQPFGVGFARYAEYNEPVARRRIAEELGGDPERALLEVRASNPHNEYLMQLAGGGIPALALLLAWIVAAALRRDASQRAPDALPGVVLAFAFACLFNSLLLDFVEGHFYMAVLAFLLARERRAAAPPAPA
jgi:O-antigen ligase